MATATASTDPRLETQRRLRQLRIEAARRDPRSFAELCIADEKTGEPLCLTAMHEEWLQLIEANSRVVIQSFIGSGKSTLISVAYVLWRLGVDPSTRIAVISSSHGLAAKLLRVVASHIERPTPELRAVFPNLKPAPGAPWNDSAITVARPTRSKDASVVVTGTGGTIVGSRIDLLICDDIISFEASRTEAARNLTNDWFHDSGVLGRVEEHGRAVVIGTAFHAEDLLSKLSEKPGWTSRRYSIEDESGAPRWPQRWSAERIAAKRAELGPLESSRQLDVAQVSDSETRIKLPWVEDAAQLGRGRWPIAYRPVGSTCCIGVDLSVSLKTSADLTAFVVLFGYPDGRREVAHVESGRWLGPVVVDKIISLTRHYGADRVVVESNAAQMFISQYAKLAGAPVMPFTTGRGKQSLEYMIEALGVEMAGKRWIFPADDGARLGGTEMQRLAADMIRWTPTAHVPDRLAALLFARVGIERGDIRAEYGHLSLGPP